MTSRSIDSVPLRAGDGPARSARADALWLLQQRAAPYLFVLPFLLLFFVFLAYPLVRSLALSFYKSAGPQELKFVGLRNYLFLVRDKVFWFAVLNTAAYAAAYLVTQVPLALGLAMLLNSKRLVGRNAFRFAFFSTHLVGQVFVAIVFFQLFSPRNGLVNLALGGLLRRSVQIGWTSNPNLLMVTVLIASLWLSVGFGMIYFLAALQGVDEELYEAAAIDGAGPWSRFWNVTIPSIRPVLVFMVLVGTIGAFQLFELPWVLFQQSTGPGGRGLTVVMYLFAQGFSVGDLGYASTIGWALVLILLALAVIQVRVSKVAED